MKPAIPPSPQHRHYKYLIIGGGMTADAAVRGIRSVDPIGEIGIVSEESFPPYNRPPLSKGLWKGDAEETIWRKTPEEHVSLHLGRTANVVNASEKEVRDTLGLVYTWEKLLLATGGSPRRLAFGDDQIIYFRSLADYRRLRSLSERGQRFAVIGAGFIGSEIAAALRTNGKEVALVYPGKNIGARAFPNELAEFVSDFYRGKGVELLPREKVIGFQRRGSEVALKTLERELLVDSVVAGIGIEPNVRLAQEAKLKVDNGIVVDEELRTSHLDIYAAGDVASFYNPALGKRIRVEHEDNANTMGKIAGWNMAGKTERYEHLPFFYSDMFELGYEAVGELDSRLETFSDWKEPNKEGVIYYLQNGRVRGVLLWNVWGQVETARKLIGEQGTFSRDTLKGRIQ